MVNGNELINRNEAIGRNENGDPNALGTYVLVRNSWKMRKELAKIFDANGRVLFQLKKRKWEDDAGVTKAEVKDESRFSQHLHVLDPLGQKLGSVLCTRARSDRSNVPQWRCVGRYSLMDPLDQLMGIAEPTDRERVIPAYAIFTPDGRVLASVHKAHSDEYYQLDILLPGLHPLVILSYVWHFGDAMSHEIIMSGKPKRP